jgi:16S rRNA (cytidine1402-2'-O)-methyltransferase
MQNILYIVATPIGNLEDISLRAIRILNEVDFILCEDTRVTKKLLSHYKIKSICISYHEHSDDKKTEHILDLLAEGKDLALVTDAGTPGISDPGGKLIEKVIFRMGDRVKIESVPGPSAVTAALSISGIPTDKFVFMGFPPHKKGRQTFLDRIIKSDFPVVIYESKHRILKLLSELKQKNKDIVSKKKELEFKKLNKIEREELKNLKPVTSLVVCRELSKMHETVYRGEIDTISKKIEENKNDQKGEFVVIIGK